MKNTRAMLTYKVFGRYSVFHVVLAHISLCQRLLISNNMMDFCANTEMNIPYLH